MKETELNKVLNYMKQYVENKYEHDSEPMLNYKDLQLVLEEIERLKEKVKEWQNIATRINEDNNKLNYIIREIREYIETNYTNDDGSCWHEGFVPILKIIDKVGEE